MMWSPLCLVKECCELESTYGPSFTKDLLTDSNCVSKCIIRKTIRGIDGDRLVLKCSTKSPFIAGVVERGGSWPKLWDLTLHLGSRHTIGLRNLSRLMSHHGGGQSWYKQKEKRQILTKWPPLRCEI